MGLAWVNSWFLRDLRTPFGGTKLSGIGREGGVHSLDFYSELTQRLRCISHRRARHHGQGPALRGAVPALTVDGKATPRRVGHQQPSPDNTIAGASVDEMGTVDLDIRVQTRAVIENIRDILAARRRGARRPGQVTPYLVNMNDFGGYNEVYGEYFDETGPTAHHRRRAPAAAPAPADRDPGRAGASRTHPQRTA